MTDRYESLSRARARDLPADRRREGEQGDRGAARRSARARSKPTAPASWRSSTSTAPPRSSSTRSAAASSGEEPGWRWLPNDGLGPCLGTLVGTLFLIPMWCLSGHVVSANGSEVLHLRFIAAEKAHHSLTLLCRSLRVRRSGVPTPTGVDPRPRVDRARAVVVRGARKPLRQPADLPRPASSRSAVSRKRVIHLMQARPDGARAEAVPPARRAVTTMSRSHPIS